MNNIVALERLHQYTSEYTTWWDDWGWLVLILSVVLALAIIAVVAVFLFRFLDKGKAHTVHIMYCYDGKEEISQVKHGEVFCAPYPSREGYAFRGWYADANLTIPFVPQKANGDFAIYAKWEKN